MRIEGKQEYMKCRRGCGLEEVKEKDRGERGGERGFEQLVIGRRGRKLVERRVEGKGEQNSRCLKWGRTMRSKRRRRKRRV